MIVTDKAFGAQRTVSLGASRSTLEWRRLRLFRFGTNRSTVRPMAITAALIGIRNVG
jgi:hypothetical protein